MCPERVLLVTLLVLEAEILELEFPWFSLSLYSTCLIPSLENLEKSVDIPPGARLELL